MPAKKKTTTKKKPTPKKKLIKIVKVKITKRKPSGIEKGFCYEKKNCDTKLSGGLVTKKRCEDLGGKSWNGTKSGCVDL